MVQQWAGAEDCFPCCSQQVSSCCLLLGANGSLGKAGSLVISTTSSGRNPTRPASADSGQPRGQVGRALEVEQGVGQGFQLLQRQGLNLGGGDLAEGAAAAVEWRISSRGIPAITMICASVLDQGAWPGSADCWPPARSQAAPAR